VPGPGIEYSSTLRSEARQDGARLDVGNEMSSLLFYIAPSTLEKNEEGMVKDECETARGQELLARNPNLLLKCNKMNRVASRGNPKQVSSLKI
jgi:hypothetical protein